MFQDTAILLLAIYVCGTSSFLLGGKTDCLITEWSAWSEPHGFGEISRDRKILRYPLNGGDPCPKNLKEVQETGSIKGSQQFF